MLGRSAIMQAMALGGIVISPFKPENLGVNSYDVTLGQNYFRPNRDMGRVDFSDPEDVREFWGEARYAARGEIVIRPGDTILAHTDETIGTRATEAGAFVAMMQARSSIGRSCLCVCKAAGVGDVGYVNRWTMEITNFSHAEIVLRTGMRVAQMLFYRVEIPPHVGAPQVEYRGKYNAVAPRQWQPDDMLPRLYEDFDLETWVHPSRRRGVA